MREWRGRAPAPWWRAKPWPLKGRRLARSLRDRPSDALMRTRGALNHPSHDYQKTRSYQCNLPVQFQRELELARVVGGGGLAGVGEERAHSGHVVDVGYVEHVGDKIQVEALAEIDLL